MGKTWFIVTYLIASVLDLYVTVKYINFFLGKLRVSKKVAGITFILCYTLSSVQYLIIPIPIINIIVTLIKLYFIARCYETKQSRILFTTALVYMFQFACEFGVWIMTSVENLKLTDIEYGIETYQLVFLAIIQIIFYFIITSFKNINLRQQFPVSFNIGMVLISGLIFLIGIMIFAEKDINNNIKKVSAFFILLVLVSIVYMYDIVSRSYVNILRAQVIERENMYYTKQAEVLQKNNDNIRKLRHDMNNYLYVLEALLDEDDENIQAKEYLEQMLGKLNEVRLYSTSGNMQLDSIVNYKLSEAADKKINVEADIKLPETLEINMDDIVTILGNILDNAIEAAEKLKDEKYIKLDIIYKMGAVFITLKNSYDGKINADNGVLKTIKSNKLEHGIGLNSVNDAVEKYNGEVKTEYDDREFCIRIILYTDNYC